MRVEILNGLERRRRWSDSAKARITEETFSPILAAGKNQNKSDKRPAKFFEDVSDNEMRRAIIDRDMLDYRRFRTFLKDRSGKIVEAVGKRLDFSDGDFGEPA